MNDSKIKPDHPQMHRDYYAIPLNSFHNYDLRDARFSRRHVIHD